MKKRISTYDLSFFDIRVCFLLYWLFVATIRTNNHNLRGNFKSILPHGRNVWADGVYEETSRK